MNRYNHLNNVDDKELNIEELILKYQCGAFCGPPGPEILRNNPKEAAKRELGLGWILYGLVRGCRPKVVVEFGFGASSFCILWALKHIGNGHLHTVDFDTTWHRDRFLKCLKMWDMEDICTFHNVESAKFVKEWNQPADFMFIDGDHSEEGMKILWNDNMAKWIKPAAYAVFHDSIGCLHAAGYRAEQSAIYDDFWMIMEPALLGFAILQKKFTIGVRELCMITGLANNSIDYEQKIRSPLHATDPRNIPGFIRPWEGYCHPSEKIWRDHYPKYEKLARKMIKDGVDQTVEEFTKYMKEAKANE